MRSPASTLNGSLAVGVQQQHLELAAVALVDQPRRVDERDPVARREARARQHEAGVAGRKLDRDPGPDAARARPGAIVAGSSARRSRPASPSCARVGGSARGSRRVKLSSTRRSLRRALAQAPSACCPLRREARVARGDGRRQQRAHEHALGRVRALDLAGDLVQLGEAAALRVGQQQLDGLQAPHELVGDALLEAVDALARRARRRARRRDGGGAARRAARRRSRRPCSARAGAAFSPAPISSSTSSTAASIASISSSSTDASTTCRIRSASAVSSSVAANASTS